MNIFKELSSTASRDLKKDVEMNMFECVGNLNKTKYLVKRLVLVTVTFLKHQIKLLFCINYALKNFYHKVWRLCGAGINNRLIKFLLREDEGDLKYKEFLRKYG